MMLVDGERGIIYEAEISGEVSGFKERVIGVIVQNIHYVYLF